MKTDPAPFPELNIEETTVVNLDNLFIVAGNVRYKLVRLEDNEEIPTFVDKDKDQGNQGSE